MTAARSASLLLLSLDPRNESDEPRSDAEPALDADDAALEADVVKLSAKAGAVATHSAANNVE